MNVAEVDIVSTILPDIPRFYTALAEWLACLLCIAEVKRRVTGWRFIGISVGALAIQVLFLEVTQGMENFLWILCMGAAVGLMYG